MEATSGSFCGLPLCLLCPVCLDFFEEAVALGRRHEHGGRDLVRRLSRVSRDEFDMLLAPAVFQLVEQRCL